MNTTTQHFRTATNHLPPHYYIDSFGKLHSPHSLNSYKEQHGYRSVPQSNNTWETPSGQQMGG